MLGSDETVPGMGLLDPLHKRLWAASIWAWTAPNVSDPRMSTVVIWVTIVIVLLVFVCQVWLMASSTMSQEGVVLSDKVATHWGWLLHACHSILFWLRCGQRVVPFGGAEC